MKIGLPLSHFESEGFEHCQRQHDECAADEANRRSWESHPSSLEDGRVVTDGARVSVDGFLVTFFHSVGKGKIYSQK